MSQDLLQHIIEIKESQARVETTVKNLQRELLGNGQPGRMTKAEDAIKLLQENRSFSNGVIYSITVGVSLLGSALMNYGGYIWHQISSFFSHRS